VQALRDTERIQTERRQARLFTFGGVVLLVGALIASNVVAGLAAEAMATWIIASYAALIGGFILFNSGLKGLAKWSRRPRRDEIIDNHLRRLNDRFGIFHYTTLGGRVYDHLVVHPGGLAALIARDSFGPISYVNGRWRRQANLLARLFNFSGPPLGNPHQEAEQTVTAVQEALHAAGITVDVRPIIVFVHPRAELTVDESAIPICRIDELAGVLHEQSAAGGLPGGTRLQLIKTLTAGMSKPDEPTAGAGKHRPRRATIVGSRGGPARRGSKSEGRNG
jgi:hypothetical protein